MFLAIMEEEFLHYKTKDFYVEIIKVIPIFFSMEFNSRKEICKILKKDRSSYLIKWILPYLNKKYMSFYPNITKETELVIAIISFKIFEEKSEYDSLEEIYHKLNKKISKLKTKNILNENFKKDLKYLEENYFEYRDYFLQLIEIVCCIWYSRKNLFNINVKNLANSLKLSHQDANWLADKIRRILSYFEQKIPNFPVMRDIYCRDDEILNIDRVLFQRMYPNANRDDLAQSIRHIKQKRVYEYLKGKDFPIRCERCNEFVYSHIQIQIHHPNGKRYDWKDLQNLPFKKIIQLLKNEEIMLVCSNCHIFLHTDNYIKYFSFIEGNNLFTYNSHRFDQLTGNIDEFIKNFSILPLIKQRWLLEVFFDYDSASSIFQYNNQNLPYFVFHHREESLKTFKWGLIKKKPITEILKWIYNDDIIPLASVDHKLVHSTQYFKFIDFIEPEFSYMLKESRSHILYNISHFKQKNIKNINDISDFLIK